MIVREAYRDVTHRICRDHYSGVKSLPANAPPLGPVEDARDTGCQWCERSDSGTPPEYRGKAPTAAETRLSRALAQVEAIATYASNGDTTLATHARQTLDLLCVEYIDGELAYPQPVREALKRHGLRSRP